MTITILQENLFPKLQDSLRFISSKPQLPILSGIAISARDSGITIRSTDLKVGFQTTVGGKIEEEGECVVPGKYLEELVGSLVAGPIHLHTTNQQMIVTQGKVKSTLTLFPSADFPPFPELGVQTHALDRKKLLSTVESCIYASSLDESRPVLASLYLHLEDTECTVAATDGYRLTVATFESDLVEKPLTALIHAKMLAEAVRILGKQSDEKIRLFVSDELSQIGLSAGDTSVLVRKTDGDFPKYEAIIPPSFALAIKVHRESLVHALKTALVVAKESSSIISLHFTHQNVSVSGSSVNVGENRSEIETNYEGEEERTIACNAKFLLDMLTRTDSEYVEISMNGELKPIRLRPEGNEAFTYIVMPFKR